MLTIFGNFKPSFTDELGCCNDKSNDISDWQTALVEATAKYLPSYVDNELSETRLS